MKRPECYSCPSTRFDANSMLRVSANSNNDNHRQREGSRNKEPRGEQGCLAAAAAACAHMREHVQPAGVVRRQGKILVGGVVIVALHRLQRQSLARTKKQAAKPPKSQVG